MTVKILRAVENVLKELEVDETDIRPTDLIQEDVDLNSLNPATSIAALTKQVMQLSLDNKQQKVINANLTKQLISINLKEEQKNVSNV